MLIITKRGKVKVISHILILYSWVIFVVNLWLYPNSGIVNGLHLACNLLFTFNLLDRISSYVSFVFHIGAIVLHHVMASREMTLPFIKPLEQSLLELLMSTLILVVVLVIMLVYYNRAYKRASDILSQSVENLRTAKTAAEEMNQLKSSFLANMSHEIRTPLNAILGINEIMRDQVSDKEVIELIDIQEKSGQRLLGTLEGILSFSKLEAQEAFNLDKVDLNMIANEVVLNQKLVADKKQIQLQIVKPTKEMLILVDETMLFQVITNLVGNAVKFTNPGGIITVLIETTNEKWAQLQVKDSGIGISDEFMSKLFEPFEQESSGRSKSYQGSGLGLSITKKFIELMGGQILVDSTKGKGSTFTILIPLKTN